jgi:hypothetical protein
MRTLMHVTLAASIAVLPAAALADDLTGSDRFLCSAGVVSGCTEDGACFQTTTYDLNMPQFIEVDLKTKRMNTTKASAQNRATDIKNVMRKDGLIVLQGSEYGKTFSFVISEKVGYLTVAVAMDGFTASVFGSCTPMPETE